MRRLLARLAAWLGGFRDESPAEYQLRIERDQLVAELALTRLELTQARSEIQVKTLEVRILSEVVERDRKRIEAETAIEAHKIVAAQTFREMSR